MEEEWLSREAWLRAALTALAQQGHQALKPGSLARALGVSRGSFYWHFANVSSFLEAVLKAWETAAVDSPLQQSSDDGQADDAGALFRLIEHAFTAPSALERAVHRWAASYQPAAVRVAHVNVRRIDVLAAMFRGLGLPESEASARGRLLYWAFVGRILSEDDTIGPEMLAQVRALLAPESADSRGP